MTETKNKTIGLKPCPYCGCGESDIRLVSDNKSFFVYFLLLLWENSC